MHSIKSKQTITTLTKQSNHKLNIKPNLYPKDIRCASCRAKIFHILNNNIIECKCKRCKTILELDIKDIK